MYIQRHLISDLSISIGKHFLFLVYLPVGLFCIFTEKEPISQYSYMEVLNPPSFANRSMLYTLLHFAFFT